jgi:hypothetical protein
MNSMTKQFAGMEEFKKRFGGHAEAPQKQAVSDAEVMPTSLTIEGADLEYVRELISSKRDALELKMAELGRSIAETTAPNPLGAEAEIQNLRTEIRLIDTKFNALLKKRSLH